MRKFTILRIKRIDLKARKNDQQTSVSVMPIVQLINPIPKESLSKEGELRNFILRVNNQLINKHFKYFFF